MNAWFEDSPTARMMAGLPVSDLGARCRHGNSLTMFCNGCYSDRGGAVSDWEQHESDIPISSPVSEQDIWDLQDTMRNLQSAVENAEHHYRTEKKSLPLFPEEG